MFLIIAGLGLILVGIVFAVRGYATATAEAKAFRINIAGQSWLILVGLGVVCLTVQYLRDGGDGDKAPPSEASVVPLDEAEFESEDPGEPYTLGDDPELDSLWRDCEAGEMQACDDLYQQSPVESDYEWFGATCGLLFIDEPPEFCTEAPLDTVLETIEPAPSVP